MANFGATAAKEGHSVVVQVIGEEEVAEALGDLKGKTPAVLKVAINAAAREARKLEIAKSRMRYALTAKGQEHLRELKQTKKATNTSLTARLQISSMRSDMAYFQHRVTQHFTGREVLTNSPEYYRGHALKETSMFPLTGGSTGRYSKGFLAEFHNPDGSVHIGMVQRVIDKKSTHTKTKRGKDRWRNKSGVVEALQTMGAPSGAKMHETVWPEVEPEIEEYLAVRTQQQIQKVIDRAKARAAAKK